MPQGRPIGVRARPGSRVRCPFCHTDVEGDALQHRCRGCGTVYHLGCIAEMKLGCGVLGCGEGARVEGFGLDGDEVEEWVPPLVPRRRTPPPWFQARPGFLWAVGLLVAGLAPFPVLLPLVLLALVAFALYHVLRGSR